MGPGKIFTTIEARVDRLATMNRRPLGSNAGITTSSHEVVY